MVSFKVLNYFLASLYSKFNSKLTTAQGHFDKPQTNGLRVEISLLIKTNSAQCVPVFQNLIYTLYDYQILFDNVFFSKSSLDKALSNIVDENSTNYILHPLSIMQKNDLSRFPLQ